MSLTRKLLESMGLEADKVATIIENHAETVEGLKSEIAKYKADAEKVPGLEERLTKAEEELKTSHDNEDWKAKFEKEHEDFESFKTEQSNKATRQAQEKAFTDMLKEAGISDKMMNMIVDTKKADVIINGIVFDKEGSVKGADTIKSQIEKDYADYISTSNTQGAHTTTPPGNSGTKLTKEEILNIKDSVERQKAIQDNHELFGF